MKKKIIIPLSILSLFLLVGCGEGTVVPSQISVYINNGNNDNAPAENNQNSSVVQISSSLSSDEPSSTPAPSSSGVTPSSEIPSSSSEIKVPLTIADFQKAIDYSNPSLINTNQTFELEQDEIILHFNSSLAIDYSSSIKTCYTYSYEKLNEIVTGNESFISTISNTLYSEGSAVYDGVNWVYAAEEATTLTGVKLDRAYSSLTIEDNVIAGRVIAGKEKNFFGADYGVSNVSFAITLEEGKLKNLVLSFKTDLDFIGDSALVNSVTTFSYNPQTIVIPK